MITLYQFATSPFTEKVRRALNYKKLGFQVHEVSRAKIPEGAYAHISATGKFPALDHDGTIVQDSTEIIEYLDKTFPDSPLTPATAYARGIAHAIEEWADESLYFYEMTMRLSWEHNVDAGLDEFAAAFPAVPRDVLRGRIIDGIKAITHAQGVGRKSYDTVVNDARRQLRALDDMLEGRDWLVGDNVTTADLAVISQVNALLYAREAREILAQTHNISGWMGRVDRIAPVTLGQEDSQ